MSTAADPLRYFRIEAREISEELERGALQIEQAATPELIARLMRLAHTLKGAAGVVKQHEIAKHTHALEDALAVLRDDGNAAGGQAAGRAAVEGILTHIDAIAALVGALGPDRPPVAARPAETGFAEPAAVRADTAEMDALLAGISEASVKIDGLHAVIGELEQARQLAEVLADRAMPAATAHGGDDAASARNRLFAEELQRLIARLEQKLKAGVDQSARDVQQAYAAAERLRFVPCSAVLAGLERAVRDAAQALGKRAQVSLKGGDVRLDPQVLGLVQRALVQLLRNAVAHGIEPPAGRLAAGKPEAGRIEIEVERRGDRVVFICSDDGRGIDEEAVRRAAEAGGVATVDLASGALLALLLKGNLSTSTAVTEISGRGVGLAVVREVAQQLNGELTARSRPGAGVRIELVVPVSLSALDVLLIETGGTVVALPLTAVQSAVRLAPGDVARSADGDAIIHDGAVTPFVPLARVMRRGTASGRAQGTRSALVVKDAAGAAAVGVDRLMGAANVVVRPVPAIARVDAIVAGIYLDARGTPRAMLDPVALVAAVIGAAAIEEAEMAPEPPVLVIDDSLTTRVLEQSILEAAGYEVDLASSAEEGLAKARARRYGLFLVDVEMPGMDGFGFVETIRADPALHAIPAILVTSRSAPEDRQRGLDAGARAYIVKSEFDQGEVLETIRGLLAA
jgi:two-component system chemotaxis sensor kinase CheA